MDNLRRVVANTVSAGCQCSFSLDRLALAVDQCPYGKSSDNMAMMRGWIYDTSDSPEQKYFPYMQKMASKDVSITAGDLKVCCLVSVPVISHKIVNLSSVLHIQSLLSKHSCSLSRTHTHTHTHKKKMAHTHTRACTHTHTHTHMHSHIYS